MDELLKQATALTEAQVSKAAHALGWPGPGERPRGRTQWKEPYRNYYFGPVDDPEWNTLAEAGLAGKQGGPIGSGQDGCYWRVTPHGQLVVQAWLVAHKAVAKRLAAFVEVGRG